MKTLHAAKEKQNHGLTFKEAIRNLSRYAIRTPFLLTILSFLCVKLSGPSAIIFYAVEIFQEAGTGVDQYLAAIITAIMRIFGGLIALLLIQKLPRKKHMMLTMSTMGLWASSSTSRKVLETVLSSLWFLFFVCLSTCLHLVLVSGILFNWFWKVKNLFYFKALVLFSGSFLLNYFLQTIKYYQVSTLEESWLGESFGEMFL